MPKVLWTQKQDIGPRPRIGHAMAYDSTRRRVVLFGGDSLDDVLFDDTWEWDGDSWTQVQDIGPGRRVHHAMAFDGTRSRTVLFGGRSGGLLLGDTWEWNGENWTQVADSGPAPRFGHAMAFDRTRQRIVLFGGDSEGRLNDTWEWDGNEWVQQADSGPSPRIHHAMAYDPTRNRLVLFGGSAQDAGHGDTWEWDGTAWTEESDFGPEACAGAAMVFKGTRMALFGGIASIATPVPQPAPALFGRSWEWDGRHWTARQNMGPGNRVFHAMAFDETRSRVVLFGGSPVPTAGDGAAASVRGDTWEQFEEGSGAGVGAVGVAAVAVQPNPAIMGSVVTIAVTLTGPAPADTVLTISLGDVEIATFEIAAGQADGAFDVQLPSESPDGAIEVTATLGTSQATTVLEIIVGVSADITSIVAEPNPASPSAPGQTLVITVTLVLPASNAVPVALLANGDQFATMVIPEGEVVGQMSFPLEPNLPAGDITLTARSGVSEATVVLVVLG